MKRIVYRPKARVDLEEIAEIIAADNLDAAIRFCQAVEDAGEKLSKMPEMGAIREFSNISLAGLRSWPIKGFRSYLIFYLSTPDGIEVVRLLHGARDIESIFSDG